MKKLAKLILLGIATCFLALLFGCQSGVNNVEPHDFAQNIEEVTLLSSYSNADGAFTYKLLLPIIWEGNLIGKWDGIGLQINDGQIQPLYAAINQNAYYWEFTTPNADVFINFGHFKRDSLGRVTWANQAYVANSIATGLGTKYAISSNGQDYIGITFRNGAISPVDPASLVRLQAIIDAGPIEIREDRPVTFSGSRSTGQASPMSKIVEYLWEFGDGQTATGMVVEHSFKVKGTYSVKLTVKDNLGNTHSSSVDIKVFKMAFPQNTLEGGDDYVQVAEDRYAKTITIYVNLSLTHGNHGKPFWWGTKLGTGTAWQFIDIQPVPLNEDWGQVVLPFSGREQFEFNYSDWYDYLDGNGRPVGVNWDHMPFSRFFEPTKGHYVILVSNEKVTRP